MSTEDIPEALRKQPRLKSSFSQSIPLLIGGLVGIGCLIVLGGLILRPVIAVFMTSHPAPSTSVNPEPTSSSEPSSPATPEPVENILGHLPYEEAPPDTLKAITPNGSIQLRQVAANQFLQMQRDARSAGVSLVPISGFRTKEEQNHLFFDIKKQRNQDTQQRAEVSAPPGYSEHHTGYAVDIGDANAPATHLSPKFENTPAFRWLQQNAARYSFELSFPPDNPQGISYEPWHWRYVGDQESLETFYKAQQLKSVNSEQ